MDSTDVEEFAERYTAAWCSGNPETVASFFSPDATLFVNGTPSTGHAAIAELAQGFMTAFPDTRLSMEGLDFDDKRVTFRWNYKGTNTGPGGTGNPVDFSGQEVWTFGEDGLVTESQGSFDANEYERQLEHGVE